MQVYIGTNKFGNFFEKEGGSLTFLTVEVRSPSTESKHSKIQKSKSLEIDRVFLVRR